MAPAEMTSGSGRLRLTFWGGAGKVTGSNFLVAQGESRVLVDCGIEQGKDFCTSCVYGAFPYAPQSIGALVVTHAHLDHVGRIPKLVRDGFRGKIYLTPPTRDLAELILRDSIGILGEEAKRLGVSPLYEARDVDEALRLMEGLEYHTEKEIAPGLLAYLRPTGHILGSASVRLTGNDGTRLALTGDIGNSPSPLLPDWEPVADVDALVMESVYGDRLHPERSARTERLSEVLKAAIARGGAILIPAFSLERTQLMLYELSNFFAAGTLPHVSVFLDSPLAISVTALYDKWGPSYFKPDAQQEMRQEGSLFNFPFLTKTERREESRRIDEAPNPKVILAGAGMSHGGRIGGHEARYLPDPSTTLIMVGYQAPGSPGRRLLEGAAHVRLGGKDVRVRGKIENLEGWSAHADRDELLRFAQAAAAPKRVKTIFTGLGEPGPARFLAQRIHDYLGVTAVAPQEGQTWEITKDRVREV